MKVIRILISTLCFLGSVSSMSAEEINYPQPQPEVLEAIKENVGVLKTVLAKQLEVKLNFDEESIKWIDDYINRNRDGFAKETKESLVDIFGSFLGEAIIKNFGGKWALKDGAVGIHLKGESWAFPFSKVKKQMYDGPEDSIYSFYTIMPMVLDGSLSSNKSD